MSKQYRDETIPTTSTMKAEKCDQLTPTSSLRNGHSRRRRVMTADLSPSTEEALSFSIRFGRKAMKTTRYSHKSTYFCPKMALMIMIVTYILLLFPLHQVLPKSNNSVKTEEKWQNKTVKRPLVATTPERFLRPTGNAATYQRMITQGNNNMTEELSRTEQPQHVIPRILIFTHYKNLLTDKNLKDEEEIILAANVQHSINMHTSIHVRFLTDEDCILSLGRVFPALIPFFQNETQGMFKADICRGSALYETGGFYLDVDVGIRHDLWSNLLTNTEFITCRVHLWLLHLKKLHLESNPKPQFPCYPPIR